MKFHEVISKLIKGQIMVRTEREREKLGLFATRQQVEACGVKEIEKHREVECVGVDVLH